MRPFSLVLIREGTDFNPLCNHKRAVEAETEMTNDLLIVGAEYSLTTGKVEFFHDD